jgi:hypothetical protein
MHGVPFTKHHGCMFPSGTLYKLLVFLQQESIVIAQSVAQSVEAKDLTDRARRCISKPIIAINTVTTKRETFHSSIVLVGNLAIAELKTELENDAFLVVKGCRERATRRVMKVFSIGREIYSAEMTARLESLLIQRDSEVALISRATAGAAIFFTQTLTLLTGDVVTFEATTRSRSSESTVADNASSLEVRDTALAAEPGSKDTDVIVVDYGNVEIERNIHTILMVFANLSLVCNGDVGGPLKNSVKNAKATGACDESTVLFKGNFNMLEDRLVRLLTGRVKIETAKAWMIDSFIHFLANAEPSAGKKKINTNPETDPALKLPRVGDAGDDVAEAEKEAVSQFDARLLNACIYLNEGSNDIISSTLTFTQAPLACIPINPAQEWTVCDLSKWPKAKQQQVIDACFETLAQRECSASVVSMSAKLVFVPFSFSLEEANEIVQLEHSVAVYHVESAQDLISTTVSGIMRRQYMSQSRYNTFASAKKMASTMRPDSAKLRLAATMHNRVSAVSTRRSLKP